jgi:hypothetical protein
MTSPCACPGSSATLFNRALVYVRLGNDAAALADLDHAISIDALDSDLYHNRALLHRRNVRARVCPPLRCSAVVGRALVAVCGVSSLSSLSWTYR